MAKREQSETEFRIPHSAIDDPAQVTQVNVREFEKRGLDIHRHEVVEIIDDHDRRERVLKVRSPRSFVDLGRRSR